MKSSEVVQVEMESDGMVLFYMGQLQKVFGWALLEYRFDGNKGLNFWIYGDGSCSGFEVGMSF